MLLRRTLAGELARVAAPLGGLRQRMRGSHVLGAYLGQADEAAARSDGNGVRVRVISCLVWPWRN